MRRSDLARCLPDDIWAVFEPALPATVWVGNGRPPASNRDGLHALWYVLVRGIAWEMLPWCFPSDKTVRRRLKDWLRTDAFLTAWKALAERDQQWHGIHRDQIPLDGSKTPSKKGGHRRGLLRSIAARSGTAIPVARGARAMPLSVVVPPANANDGCQTHTVLAALVVRPPEPEVPAQIPDDRGRPTARADGAYGNQPSRDRAASQGFRLQAPGRGQKRPGVGKVRNAVERCHNFRAQFGRVARRLDRDARHDLGWCQMAACLIFGRSGFVP